MTLSGPMHDILSLTVFKCTTCQQRPHQRNRFFFAGHDPYTLACKARPPSTDVWTFLSVIVIVIVIVIGHQAPWVFLREVVSYSGPLPVALCQQLGICSALLLGRVLKTAVRARIAHADLGISQGLTRGEKLCSSGEQSDADVCSWRDVDKFGRHWRPGTSRQKEKLSAGGSCGTLGTAQDAYIVAGGRHAGPRPGEGYAVSIVQRVCCVGYGCVAPA